MNKEEIVEAISDDKMMPYVEPYQLSEIVDFVIENYKPSPPSNLDEAAKEHVIRTLGEDVVWDENARCALLDFKAGAEWLAEQGMTKEAVIGMATGKIIISVSEQTLSELDLCPGDKVVVQIRKK